MHQRIHAPVVKAILGVHAGDPERAAQVVNPAAAVGAAVAPELGVPGGRITLAAPLGPWDPKDLHRVPFAPVKG